MPDVAAAEAGASEAAAASARLAYGTFVKVAFGYRKLGARDGAAAITAADDAGLRPQAPTRAPGPSPVAGGVLATLTTWPTTSRSSISLD